MLGTIAAVPVLAAASAGAFVIGLAGDRIRFKGASKVVALIPVACVFLLFDLRLHWFTSITLDSLLTIFWIVGVTSAFNLLDSLDGLCAGIALIAGTAFLVTLGPLQEGTSIFPAAQHIAVLLGAVAGLLIYNTHPASVVLGESGSLFIGLNMAAMTVQVAPGRGSDLISVVGVPLLVLLVPFVDAALVAVRRIRAGVTEAPLTAATAHGLVTIGLSERAAVTLLWALAAVSGLIGVAAERSRQGVSGLLALTFTFAMGLFALYLARVTVHRDADEHMPRGAITPLGIEFRYRRRLAEVILDIMLVSFAYYAAYRLRFEGVQSFAANFDQFARSYPIVLAVQMIALLAAGAYRGMWRYFSLSDGLTFVKATVIGVIISELVIWYRYHFDGYSQSVFVLYGMMLLLLTVGSRASFRLLSEFVQRRRRSGHRLVLYGAGDAGSTAVHALLNDPRSRYRILGFVDDDARKRNVRVHGYRVIGGYDHLVGMIVANEIDVVAVTQEGIDTDGMAKLCAQYGVALYRVGLDWLQIAAEPLVAGGAVARGPGEARVVGLRGLVGTAPGMPEHRHLREVAPMAGVSRALPIRVVHVITRLILGGAQENTLYTVIGQHRDPRFDVTLLCGIDEAGEGNLFGPAARAGVNMTVLPSLLREVRPLTDVKAVVDLYRFFKRGGFTVVHTHSSKAGIVGRIAARLARVPVVVHTIHGLAFHEYQSAWKNKMYVLLERVCAPLADRLISVSGKASQAAITQGVGRRDQHITIFSGIELDLFLSVRQRLTPEEAKRRIGIPSEALVVGKVARLFALKGHDQFLDAAARIAREIPATYFLLVGDGPLRDELRRKAERLGIADRLVMVRRVPPDTVPEHLQAMDVVVHTSLREGIARVLPQAGAVGKPVVTFDLDGAPEVVHDGISGYLVPPVNVDAIAQRTIELLRDPERRLRFGEAGRRFAAEHFSVEQMVERVSGVYLDLLSERSAHPGRVKAGPFLR
jgi:UDP-GlcNAc:undecaprenyl-phosphate GlcNAc-1-phosphate transferase